MTSSSQPLTHAFLTRDIYLPDAIRLRAGLTVLVDTYLSIAHHGELTFDISPDEWKPLTSLS